MFLFVSEMFFAEKLNESLLRCFISTHNYICLYLHSVPCFQAELWIKELWVHLQSIELYDWQTIMFEQR